MKISGTTASAGEDVIAFEVSDTIPESTSFRGGTATSVVRLEFVKIKN